MRRVNDERGAVAVVVALVMVPLIGFAALSLDVAAMHWERQQLQVGADAAALAIASDCGRGACGTPTATALALARANHRAGTATTTLPLLTTSKVTVRAATTRSHTFGKVLGVRSAQISAQSTVAWGTPSGGTAVLPLAFSWCEWRTQTGGVLSGLNGSASTATTILFTKTSNTGCTGPSGNAVPGGFGWLRTNGVSCQATSAAGNTLYSDPGNSIPGGCDGPDFNNLRNKTVLLPLYDQAGDTGSNAFYRIYGYAAFVLTEYHFGGQNSYPDKQGPCKGDDRCVKGYFTRYVDLTEAFTLSNTAPSLGATIVKLES